MSSANTYVEQVGGSHYKAGPPGRQHWDIIEKYDIGYLEGNASKYVARWRKKGMPQRDLRKAISYVNKIIVTRRPAAARRVAPPAVISNWCYENGMDATQTEIICLLHVMGDWRAMALAQERLEEMLLRYRAVPWWRRIVWAVQGEIPEDLAWPRSR
jgi:hypothetical protein